MIQRIVSIEPGDIDTELIRTLRELAAIFKGRTVTAMLGDVPLDLFILPLFMTLYVKIYMLDDPLPSSWHLPLPNILPPSPSTPSHLISHLSLSLSLSLSLPPSLSPPPSPTLSPPPPLSLLTSHSC